MPTLGIADYAFEQQLGSGNHGDIWMAKPPARLGLASTTRVAVKTLAEEATEDEFARMAETLQTYASIDSPHLAPILDAGQQDGRLFYTTKYFADGSLGTPARPVDRALVIQAVADAARGAHAMHQAGMVHRDIKPSNIMLLEGRGQLADLEIAQAINPGQTTTGIGPINSIEYLAPEVVKGEPASRASDIWSLGVSLHRSLSGRSIYHDLPADSILEGLRQIVSDRPVIDSSLTDLEQAIVSDCLEPDPESRFPTAEQLANAIEGLVA